MTDDTLHERLETLGTKIHAAEARLREEAHLHHDSMHLTAKELRDRYNRLQARLNGDIADAEAHGQRISNLERSVRQWIDSFDTTHTASY
ncbi:hypothetical protein FIU94_11155 [Sulfitobacter sp. THAF37]|uniref:3-ketoacyl-ACP reductase n=1 Tax=Sulfitobacter sp. THAF37 TaxID=2587855 RepID=UPI001268E929|nr:3-ketoacyl-ACP reductase [Sulfitobacter sp. THAF37]QFT59382.1 hypothetical protein FIU94_11155 [Sulfitobacter sp. THAF37]